MNVYMFKYDEIRYCSECPLFFEARMCALIPYGDCMKDNEYTDYEDQKRPYFCPLKEVI